MKKTTAQKRLFNKIVSVFCGAGFVHLKTEGREFNLGRRKSEIDSLFIYENIWLICEDTTSSDMTNHARTKNETVGEIKNNLRKFVDWLKNNFQEYTSVLSKYELKRIKIFGLYVPYNEYRSGDTDFSINDNLKLIQPQTLDYFKWLVDCIKLSALPEIFRFLNISNDDIGNPTPSSVSSVIQSAIICPSSITGTYNKVRVVSFMMSADELMQTCCVLRRDDWNKNDYGYQRLIDKIKIKSIREFVLKNGEAFYNNVIVALPDNVSFTRDDGQNVDIDDIVDFKYRYTLHIPKAINSIFIIDGQHRIYAHYKDNTNEEKMQKLRSGLHLLVSGLVFPRGMSDSERRRIQAKIFLDINKNAKAVDPSLLMHINSISEPIADYSIAKGVIDLLNDSGVFRGKFNLSGFGGQGIRIATIIRFVLSKLVSVNRDDKGGLFFHWLNSENRIYSRADVHQCKSEAVEEYKKFCFSQINSYFTAVKKIYSEEWNFKTKILSVTAINGFLIAYGKILAKKGVCDSDFFAKGLKKHRFNFADKKNFPYTSSHYASFGEDIIRHCFDEMV